MPPFLLTPTTPRGGEAGSAAAGGSSGSGASAAPRTPPSSPPPHALEAAAAADGATLSVLITKHKELCGMRKGGRAGVRPELIARCVRVAQFWVTLAA